MDYFIQEYIIRRNNEIKSYNKYKEVSDKMSIEDYLKSETKRMKFNRFFLYFRHIRRDSDYGIDNYNFIALINYLRLIDRNYNYEIELTDFLYNCYFENIYDKAFEIEEKYRNKSRDDCYFYDSDDEDARNMSEDEFDSEDELEISKYILDFFKLHNINSNEELQIWLDKTIEDYFWYIGLDINLL